MDQKEPKKEKSEIKTYRRKRKCRKMITGSVAHQAYHALLEMGEPLTDWELAELIDTNTRDGLYNLNRTLSGWVKKRMYFKYNEETRQYSHI